MDDINAKNDDYSDNHKSLPEEEVEQPAVTGGEGDSGFEDYVDIDRSEAVTDIGLEDQPSVTLHSPPAETPVDHNDLITDGSSTEPNREVTFEKGTAAVGSSETPDSAEVPAKNGAPDECEGGFAAESGARDKPEDDFHETGRDSEERTLPEEYRKGLVVLQCESTTPGGICDVYLVGTAHVSLESCREVQAVIHFLKPQVVFLELCPSRVAMLVPQNLEVPSIREMIDMWRNRHINAFGVIYSWFLAKVAAKLEVFPGSEFRIAYEEAMSYGAKVILGDRPVQITLRRTWAKMSLWHKTKFLFCMFFQAIWLPSPEELNKMMRQMGDVDVLTLVIQEMSKTFPSLIETLVNERDLYMSSTLLKVAKEHASVVAVVGRGHLSGIEKNWMQPVSVNSLLEVPVAKSASMKFRTAVALAVGGVAIFSGFYWTRKK